MSDDPGDRILDDWDPASPAVQADQPAAYDAMRKRCPVAHSRLLGWSVFRHTDVMRVLDDPATFSNVVSTRRSVPNGMDPPEHTAYRRIVENYFGPGRMAAFEPTCRRVASALVQSLEADQETDAISAFAYRFAVQVQCAFLGWPPELEEPMHRWTKKNYRGRLSADRQAMARIAEEFDGYVAALLRARRGADGSAGDDITSSLLHERLADRPLSDEEITSILRNFTVGEVGTISAAVGILLHDLAQHTGLQQQLRATPALLPAAIEEILRRHGPLVTNRRVTTRAVEIGGRHLPAHSPVTINWVSANRDERTFDDPDAVRLDRDQTANLLYGAGLHVCPGAPLARLELRVVMEEVLSRTRRIELVAGKPPVPAVYPASGFDTLFLRVG